MAQTSHLCTGYLARTKTVAFFAIAYLLAAIIMQLMLGHITFSDVLKFELFPKLKPAYLQDWQQNGYTDELIMSLFWDFPYMLAYGGLLLSLIISQSCRAAVKVTHLFVYILFPVAAVIFDFLENMMELYNLMHFPKFSNTLLVVSSILSWVKWIAVGISLGIIIYLFVRRFNVKE